MDALNRIVIGMKIPIEIGRKVEEAQMLYKRRLMGEQMRWIPAPELVLALVNPGEMRMDGIARIQGCLEPVLQGVPKMNFKVEGVVGVPNNIQPRYVDAVLHGDTAQLEALQKRIQGALVPIIGVQETRPFQAQFTIGRLSKESEQGRGNLGRAVKTVPIGELGNLEISEIQVLQSMSSGAGVTLASIKAFYLS